MPDDAGDQRAPWALLASGPHAEGGVEQVEFDSVLAEMQDRVRARRASGDYPEGLEAQLEAEFDAILASVRRDEVTTDELSARIASVGHWVAAVDGGTGPVQSRLPGGSTVHATTGRLVQRHTGHLAEGVRAMGLSVHGALQEILRLLDAQRAADERQLGEVVANLYDRLAVIDHLVHAVSDLERRLEAVEQPRSSA